MGGCIISSILLSRSAKQSVFKGVTFAALMLCGATLLFLLGSILHKGLGAFSLEFFFTESRNFGASGGILYQILGSLLLVVVAAALVLPIALGTAIYRAEFVTSAAWKRRIDSILFSLNGIPSITFGIFGLILFVNVLGTGISWFVGSIILAIMMLPTVTLTSYRAMLGIPMDYRENARALGLSQNQVIRSVIIPQSLHGVVTGLMLGLARAIGETAPIMFIATAFSGVTVPRGVLEPVATLPTHILALAQQATNPDALRNAWGASLTLVSLVILFSVMAYCARLKLNTLSQR